MEHCTGPRGISILLFANTPHSLHMPRLPTFLRSVLRILLERYEHVIDSHVSSLQNRAAEKVRQRFLR